MMMTLQKVIIAPRAGRPDPGSASQVMDPWGKGKPRFSLSVEQKVPHWTFCDPVNVHDFAKSHHRATRGAPGSRIRIASHESV